MTCWSKLTGYPVVVSQIYVHGAERLENQDRTGGERTLHNLIFKLSHTLQGNISKNVSDILGVYSALPNGWLILRHCTGADPYVIVSCEGSSVRSTVKADTVKPVFDTRAIFYRKKPTKPITVEVRYMGVKEHHYQSAGRTNWLVNCYI